MLAFRILGTSSDAIDLAEDRERFQKLLEDLDLRQPPEVATSARRGGRLLHRSATLWSFDHPMC